MAACERPPSRQTVITVARSFVAAALFGYFFDLLQQTHNHLVNAAGRPFGDDWVNYWSGGYLALHGRAAEIYDLHAFHAFQQTIVGSPLDGYHYSYPPVMLLLERAVRAHPLCAGAVRVAIGELVRVLPRAEAGDAGARRAAARARRACGADQRGRRAERMLDGGLARRRLEPPRAAALSRRRLVRADDLQAAARAAASRSRSSPGGSGAPSRRRASPPARCWRRACSGVRRRCVGGVSAQSRRAAADDSGRRQRRLASLRVGVRGGAPAGRAGRGRLCDAGDRGRARLRRGGVGLVPRARAPPSGTPCCCSAPVWRRRMCRITIWCSARWWWRGCGSSRSRRDAFERALQISAACCWCCRSWRRRWRS